VFAFLCVAYPREKQPLYSIGMPETRLSEPIRRHGEVSRALGRPAQGLPRPCILTGNGFSLLLVVLVLSHDHVHDLELTQDALLNAEHHERNEQ
jgi:hypothetical protein